MGQAFREVRDILGPSDIPVLIHGPTGTGKEGLALGVHRYSPRRGKPFIPVNCACIPEDIAESELFGHLKGAFTGATASKKGVFEAADGGTIFLDELDKISLQNQGRLLRVLQEGEVRPVGSNSAVKIDVRVIAACKSDPQELLRNRLLLPDLYYRLAGDIVQIRALRSRPKDVPSLARLFCRRFAAERKCRMETISRQALRMLKTWPWPGNVRELENVVRSAVARHAVRRPQSCTLQVDDLPSAFRQSWQEGQALHTRPECSDEASMETAMPYDTTALEQAILSALMEKSPRSVPDIARRVSREKSAVHRRVNQMATRGLVRVRHRKGRGGTLVSLPPDRGNVTYLARQSEREIRAGEAR